MAVVALLGAWLWQAALAGPAQAQTEFSLQSIHEEIVSDFADVRHLQTDRLDAVTGPVALIDVRTVEEFAVSRLQGAQRVDPSIWRNTFLERYAGRLKGKTVIFYCSVGVRSSRLAAAVQKDLLAQGAVAVFNLEGGIFKWHNEGKPLTASSGDTRFVHPYSDYWGQLLTRRDLITYSPQ